MTPHSRVTLWRPGPSPHLLLIQSAAWGVDIIIYGPTLVYHQFLSVLWDLYETPDPSLPFLCPSRLCVSEPTLARWVSQVSHIGWRLLFVIESSSRSYSNYPYQIKAPEHITDQFKSGTTAHFLSCISVCHIILNSNFVYLPDSILKTAVNAESG